MLEIFKIADIQTRPDIQIRMAMNEEAVNIYADLYREGVQVCPVSVWHDHEGNLILVDGHHRLEAAKRAGLTVIEAYDEGTGDIAAFIEESIKANSRNGLALTRQDRKRAVEMLFKYHPKMTVRAMAEKVGLSKSLVGNMVSDLRTKEVAVCRECKASVLRMFAEDSTNGWVSTYQHEKELWFCCEEHRANFFAKQAEKSEAARLARMEKEDAKEEYANETSAAPDTPALTGHLSERGECMENENGTVMIHDVHERCPFCGSRPTVREAGGDFSIDCINENCTAQPYTDTFETIEEAWAAWDKRSERGKASKRENAFLERLKNGIFVGKHHVRLQTEPEGVIFLGVAIADEYGKLSQYMFD